MVAKIHPSRFVEMYNGYILVRTRKKSAKRIGCS